MWEPEEIRSVQDKVEKGQKEVDKKETALELQRGKVRELQKEAETIIKSNELRMQRQAAVEEEEVLEEGKEE